MEKTQALAWIAEPTALELTKFLGRSAFAEWRSLRGGNGEYLPLVGDFMSFNEIIDTLDQQGHGFSFRHVPKEAFAASFPGAADLAEMFGYFEAHSYLGSNSTDQIAFANKIAGRQPTKLSAWARVNFTVRAAAV